MNKQFVYFVIIAQRKLSDELKEEAEQSGGALICSMYGKGYYESTTLDLLGLGANDEGKIIISGIISLENGERLIEKLNTEHAFEKVGTGIAYLVPIEKIVY